MRNRCTNSRPQKSGFQNPSTIPISFSLPTHRPPIEHHPVRFFPSLQIHLRCSLLRDPSDQIQGATYQQQMKNFDPFSPANKSHPSAIL
ncbi:hypothetical protein F383_21351 [Gossypium arboreum]|uniref:Uncharacterized protein n=1 Tax=Gossypium arboreum TaxID=29729 RepID=A0A0B0MM02_GOSAR|nr:hypothetical protein F383_21351 [Gossypium arboreum]